MSTKKVWQYGADGLVQSAIVEHVLYISAALAAYGFSESKQAIANRSSVLFSDMIIRRN